VICVEKNSELPDSHPNRKFKGRYVFQGNRVVDQNWEQAMFQDMSSSPATLEAARVADCVGCFEGNDVQMADAVQAYIQAELSGDPCWVVLPAEARPTEWANKYYRPVVRLKKALYGHPDSGTMWEKKCDAHVKSKGFAPIGIEWPSVYWNAKLQLILVVYVDDFKLAGPKKHLPGAWAALRDGLNIEPEAALGMYLGCQCTKGTIDLPDGGKANSMVYDMESFLEQCIERYMVATKYKKKLKDAATPFLAEDQKDSPAGRPADNGPAIECPWCLHTFAYNKIKHFLDNPKSSSTTKGGPPGDKNIDLDRGELAAHCANILMKILYGARMCRFDLLRAVAGLACYLTKWSVDCDKKLYRLMCYINSSKHLRMIGWVGDKPTDLQCHLFADADFAGCTQTQRSTSGIHLCVRGPRSCFPIAGHSKRQTCVSHSTPEAEIVAADAAVRTCGIPALILWTVILPHIETIYFHEDNQAMIQVMKTGRNPNLRYIDRKSTRLNSSH
jgi:hypothetical protein